eukprot:m.174739 g.174739  ORF g.174739 m.174739 type:complete len:210 (+) comp16755_c0_seq8:60-689(+)
MGDDSNKASTAFEKACKVCSGFGDMFKQVNGREKPVPKPKHTPVTSTAPPPPTTTTPPPTEPAAETTSPYVDNDTYTRHSDECPEDYLSLGSKSWSFLHTIAAYYKPSAAEDASDMAQFLRLVGKFYPCRDCGEHFESYINDHPVQAQTPQELALWLCQAHNAVNERLGKPVFDCNLVEDRWKEVGGLVPYTVSVAPTTCCTGLDHRAM